MPSYNNNIQTEEYKIIKDKVGVINLLEIDELEELRNQIITFQYKTSNRSFSNIVSKLENIIYTKLTN